MSPEHSLWIAAQRFVSYEIHVFHRQVPGQRIDMLHLAPPTGRRRLERPAPHHLRERDCAHVADQDASWRTIGLPACTTRNRSVDFEESTQLLLPDTVEAAAKRSRPSVARRSSTRHFCIHAILQSTGQSSARRFDNKIDQARQYGSDPRGPSCVKVHFRQESANRSLHLSPEPALRDGNFARAYLGSDRDRIRAGPAPHRPTASTFHLAARCPGARRYIGPVGSTLNAHRPGERLLTLSSCRAAGQAPDQQQSDSLLARPDRMSLHHPHVVCSDKSCSTFTEPASR